MIIQGVDNLTLYKSPQLINKIRKIHNDILIGENSYHSVDHQTNERDLSYFIFFSGELLIQKTNQHHENPDSPFKF